MAARLLPLIALFSLSIPNPWSDAGPESALSLEPVVPSAPFRVGDQLQLDAEGAGALDVKMITVLQMVNWPWVLVRFDTGRKPYEEWINFAQIRTVRRM